MLSIGIEFKRKVEADRWIGGEGLRERENSGKEEGERVGRER